MSILTLNVNGRAQEVDVDPAETSITVVAPAVGNAVFDATGVRLREVPFTPERVLAALKSSPSDRTQ